MKMPTSRAAR